VRHAEGAVIPIVCLYHVGRNLNRCYRTCEAFGITDMLLFDCGELTDNLYGARDRVRLNRSAPWPSSDATLCLETNASVSIRSVDWSHVAIGGETQSLSRNKNPAAQWAKIPTTGNVSGLTSEAALAIALYEWSSRCL